MLNLINSTNRQIALKNSVWMFNPNFGTIYLDKFDFIRFNDKDELEYLNGKAEVLSKDTFTFDEHGRYKIERDPFFKGIELVKPKEINLVFDIEEYMEDDDYHYRKDMRLNFTKLTPTKLEIGQEEFLKIQAYSEWELSQPKGKSNKVIRFTEWIPRSSNEVEKAMQNSREYLKHKKLRHLIKIEDSILAVQQKLGRIRSKLLVSKLTAKEIILINHFKDNEKIMLKRKKI